MLTRISGLLVVTAALACALDGQVPGELDGLEGAPSLAEYDRYDDDPLGAGAILAAPPSDLDSCFEDADCLEIERCQALDNGCTCRRGKGGGNTCQPACTDDSQCGGDQFFCWKGACKPIDPAFCYKGFYEAENVPDQGAASPP